TNSPHRRLSGRPRVQGDRSVECCGQSSHPRRAASPGRDPDWRYYLDALNGAAVHRQTNRAGDYLRRPGGDRDRERAAVRRSSGAHGRIVRIAGAADRDIRNPRVISTSPGELEPVFQTMLANATRLCEASYGILWLREGAQFRTGAFYGALPAAY